MEQQIHAKNKTHIVLIEVIETDYQAKWWILSLSVSSREGMFSDEVSFLSTTSFSEDSLKGSSWLVEDLLWAHTL